MKTPFVHSLIIAALLVSCHKESIKDVEVVKETPSDESNYDPNDTIIIDSIYAYYVDGEPTPLGDITETDEQVWATYINEFDQAICEVFDNDAEFLSWWDLNGATQAELDYYIACMEVRDYALLHNIPTEYPDEEDLHNLPQHFQEYVLLKIPDYYGGSEKNGNSTNQALVHAYIKVHANQNMAGASRDFTTVHSHWGSFRNQAESGLLFLGGVTVFCDWIWYGGRKWPFITLLGAQFNSLGTGNNRFDSHF